MNYEIDQTKLSERVLTLIKSVGIPAGLYVFLSFIIVFLLYSIGFITISGSMEDFLKMSSSEEVEQFLLNNSERVLILNTLISVALYFLLSGIYGMIIQNRQNAGAGLGAAFKTLFSGRGFKALVFIFLLQTLIGIVNYLFNILELTMVGLAIGILIQFLTYFVLPALYVENKSFTKSISLSTNIVNSKPAFFFLVILMTYIFSFSGIFMFGIGLIFTLPLNYIMAYSLFSLLREEKESSES